MNLNHWFANGITPEAYIASMKENKDETLHIYNQFTCPSEADTIQKLQSAKLRVIILTEDWCGDAMLNVPVLLRLAELTDMPVSILHRDENLELMDQYLTNGTARSIPIFIFIDEDGNEVAKWGPRAQEVQRFADASVAELPPQEADDFQEKRLEMFQNLMATYRNNEQFRIHVYNSILECLKNRI
ncbi:thioredoxin family protein [Lentibacillus saliphilus]|uniref:thioredoxin family protein n=1 Tax=Lentibacillus saliphilus TaxID=2737028 RepID=UPI001C305098|nr:thioredoxin family protein [Lentibacillus saliphilus]